LRDYRRARRALAGEYVGVSGDIGLASALALIF